MYLRVSYSFTQVYEMADWKTLLLKMPFLMPSCVQTKKRNHAGETKSWPPAVGPIYSSTETNSRFQAGGPATFQQKKIVGYQLEVLCTVQKKQIFGHRHEVLYAV